MSLYYTVLSVLFRKHADSREMLHLLRMRWRQKKTKEKVSGRCSVRQRTFLLSQGKAFQKLEAMQHVVKRIQRKNIYTICLKKKNFQEFA